MMINTNFYECAAAYLYAPARKFNNVIVSKKGRKVEDTDATYTGKKFNKNAANKAAVDHIDVCI